GSNLVERLVQLRNDVRVVDNFITGKRENLAALQGQFELVEGDLADPAACAKACKGVQVILHEAALPSVPKSVANPALSHRCNLEATLNLLLAARDGGVKRFIYAASSSAYGESPTLPKIESMPSSPLSPYAVQKLACEQYCTVFARCYGLETISLRYFNVFGPRQDPSSDYAAAIPAFVSSILRGEPPKIYGDGEQTRDFTHIDNVIEANLLAANAPKTSGEVVNIACGERLTINQVITQINQLLGKNIRPEYLPPRAGDIKHSWADISLAEKVLGFRPRVKFNEGLKRAIDWYRANL
ncbi:MAG TPA: SDR family oxidoreductase, partial [Phycisphaerae bacterium]|nr:SDR family oxidoreductase [Phycisphaerae bacterium]